LAAPSHSALPPPSSSSSSSPSSSRPSSDTTPEVPLTSTITTNRPGIIITIPTTVRPPTSLPSTPLPATHPSSTTQAATSYNQRPCWKYDPASYSQSEARGEFVAPIGTPITVSFFQLDWYAGDVNIVRVNSDCSEVVVATSHPKDETSFTSFVGQQWVTILATDYIVSGTVYGHKGDQLWNDLAGRQNGAAYAGVPDGYDPWPIPPCC
jgi:hypothetical protein